jgi:ADP-ribosylglycohydrolase
MSKGPVTQLEPLVPTPLGKRELHRSPGHSPISWEIVIPALRREKVLEGALLGCAVADALSHLVQSPNVLEARKEVGRFSKASTPVFAIPGDRTHSMIIAIQAVLRSKASIDELDVALRQRIRWYRLARPFAVATRWIEKAISRSTASHGFTDLGCDPLTRAAILSVILQGHSNGGLRWVQRSTIVTHRDVLSSKSAMLVAIASQCAQMSGTSFEVSNDAMMPMLIEASQESVLESRLRALDPLVRERRPVMAAARVLGYRGRLSGSLAESALLAIYSWLRYDGDYRASVVSLLQLGGDAGLAATIAGTLSAIQHGAESIPEHWVEQTWMEPHDSVWRELYVERMRDWPHGPEDIQRTLSLPIRPFGQWRRNVVFATWKGTLPLRKIVGSMGLKG